MSGRRLKKNAHAAGNNKNEPALASSRVRDGSAVRPPNGPLNSHPVDKTTRRMTRSVARRISRRHGQLIVGEAPPPDATGRRDVMPQGPSYLIWNDAEARMLRAGETGGASRVSLPPRRSSAVQRASPRRSQGCRGDKKARERPTDGQPVRPSDLRHLPHQKPERSLPCLRSKYCASEVQNRASPPGAGKFQSLPVNSGGAGDGASPAADQPTQRRRSLRHRASQRLRRTASNLSRRLSSSCGSFVSSDGDETPAAGRERPEETEASHVGVLLAWAVPGRSRRVTRPTNIR